MSHDDLAPESEDRAVEGDAAPSAPAPPETRTPRADPSANRRGGSLALALLLALLALGLAGLVAWRQWRADRGEAAQSRAVAALESRVDTLQAASGRLGDERALLRQRLGDAEQVNRALREELLAQSGRLRDLEDAVGKLSEKSLSGRDGMLLDETESLLRLGQQRYALFHDAHGAAAAYDQAGKSLAGVDDAAFSGVRESIAAERAALEKAQPDRGSALAALQQWRGRVASLPLRSRERPARTSGASGWSRIGQALAGVISVQRDDGAPLAAVDGRLARELVALDLAQAQAALLAHDPAAARAAIGHAVDALATQFETTDPAVAQAHDRLASLAATLQPAEPVELGAALTELRNLRAVHALRAVGPAPARSTGGAPHDGAGR